jgi:hypothetical protein
MSSLRFHSSGRIMAGSLLSAACLCVGCTTTTSRLTFTPTPAEVSTNLPPPFQLLPVEDLRNNTTTIGQAGGRPFDAEGVLPWLDSELLNTCSNLPRSSGGHAGTIVRVQPKLHKIYVDTLSVNKIAIIVLELEITYSSSDKVVRRIYRGSSTGVNWWNSDAEFRQALGLALKDCLKQCRVTLEASGS